MQKETFLPCLGGYGRQETRPKTQIFFSQAIRICWKEHQLGDIG